MAEISISYPNFLDWRTQNKVFEKIGVSSQQLQPHRSGEAERIVTGQMSADCSPRYALTRCWAAFITTRRQARRQSGCSSKLSTLATTFGGQEAFLINR